MRGSEIVLFRPEEMIWLEEDMAIGGELKVEDEGWMRWKREAPHTMLGFVEASQLSNRKSPRIYILIVARPTLVEAYIVQ